MSKTIRIGINGFGRIGKTLLRLALKRKNFQIVAINDSASPTQIVQGLKYDSVQGPLDERDSLRLEKNHLYVGDHSIRLTAEKNPALLRWSEVHADIILECTGALTKRDQAALHLQAGAKKVIISAPSSTADITLCLGVNQSHYLPQAHHILSNASCTTNCLAPIVKILDDHFGIHHGTLLTIHSYTNDQRLLDGNHKDPRRSRAATLSQIPTTTGAAIAVGEVIPHLKGKLDGLAIRVPTPNVSLLDLTAQLKTATSIAEINQTFERAANGPLHQILGYSTEPLVSCDFQGRQQSAIIDAALTHLIDQTFVKVIAWYDNETGFSARMLDLAEMIHA